MAALPPVAALDGQKCLFTVSGERIHQSFHANVVNLTFQNIRQWRSHSVVGIQKIICDLQRNMQHRHALNLKSTHFHVDVLTQASWG